MMDKPKKGTKVKTVERGMLPEVTVKSRPEFAPRPIQQFVDEVKAMKAKKDSTSKMKMGGALKPVPAGKKGLAKLPTPVRNKMGFQKNGGKVKK